MKHTWLQVIDYILAKEVTQRRSHGSVGSIRTPAGKTARRDTDGRGGRVLQGERIPRGAAADHGRGDRVVAEDLRTHLLARAGQCDRCAARPFWHVESGRSESPAAIVLPGNAVSGSPEDE